MEYRKIPKSGQKVSTIAIGSGSVHASDARQTSELIDFAQAQGINLIDLALSQPEPLDHYGAALRGRRDQFVLQMHLGMSFESGEYARDYELASVQRNVDMYLRRVGTDYTDIALFHCIDAVADFAKIVDGGVLEYALSLKKQGVIRHIGFASHTVDICNRFLETGAIDLFMFSINAAYDLDPAGQDPYGEDKKAKAGFAVSQDRQRLYQRCVKEGIGITVMKAYGGGKLLDAKTSPFGRALSTTQCIRYALDRPAVLACVLGVHGRAELGQAVDALRTASPEEADYAFISTLQPKELDGSCVYCNHCMPCPAGIDIGMTHKFLDLSLIGDDMAREHYRAMDKNASDCLACGVCEGRCPFHVDVRAKMRQAVEIMGA